jgi:hypothetical protein
MTTNPQVTKSDIARWVGKASFEEGVSYLAKSGIMNSYGNGMMLQAECLGPSPDIYQMEVRLDAEGIFESRCSCPVGGTCQHVAALLLTWLEHPDAFDEAGKPTSEANDTLPSELTQRSKEELIGLIDQMVVQAPELVKLLYLPLKRNDTTLPIEPEMIQQQVALVMSNYDDTDINSYAWLAEHFAPLLEIGDEYAKAADWITAAMVYDSIACGLLDERLSFMDDHDYLGPTIRRCIMGLEKCLRATEETTAREKMLRALFDINYWDVTSGGIEIQPQPSGLLLTHATPAEKERLATWTQAAIERGAYRQCYQLGGFLLQFATPLSDESYLRICHETGRGREMVNRLLDLGRVAEAEAETRSTKDYHFIEQVNLFVSHNHATVAERLVRERITQRREEFESPNYYSSHNLYKWLKEHAMQQGKPAKVLEITLQMFFLWPAWSRYQEIKKLANQQGRWKTLRPKMMAHLGEKKCFYLLTQIHLSENNVEHALATVAEIADDDSKWLSKNLPLQVAQATEQHHPREAIRLYIDEINNLIAPKKPETLCEWEQAWDFDRGEFDKVATYLVRVRNLYFRLGDEAQWQTLIDQMRTEHGHRVKLMDELDKVGL